MKINQLYNGKKTEISIIAHLQSIKDDSELKDLEYLLDFNLSKGITVKIAPDKDLHNILLLDRFNIQNPSYSIINKALCLISTATMERSHSTTYITSHFSKKEKLYNSNISNWDIDYFDNDRFDIIVVGRKDIDMCKANKLRGYTTDVFGAMELLRLFLLKNQRYEIRPRHKWDRTGYYLYFMKRRLRNFQYCWSIAIYSKDDDLISRLRSIGSRTQYTIEALDYSRIEFLAGPSVNTINTFAYHFAYLMMLATGLLDDFAHLFNKRYKLELKKFEKTLRVEPLKQHSKFTKRILTKNPKIAELIESMEYKALIELIYQLRDRYQHRLFLSSHKANSFDLEIDEQLVESIPEASKHVLKEEKIVQDGLERKEHCIDLGKFLDYFEDYYFKFVNTLCDEVDLSKNYNDLDESTQDLIQSKCRARKQSPWNLVGNREVPTILEHKFM